MKFIPLDLSGAWLIELERREDARGWFARTYCAQEFEQHGLPTHMVQTNASLTRRSGTLRGLHYQAAPDAEDKLVRCVRGSIWDVLVDLRPRSPTYCRWFGTELNEDNGHMLLVPKGFAHGFVTLSDDAVVTYQVSAAYAPQSERGARWDDPAFGVAWPVPVLDMSEKDRNWPTFVREAQ